MHPSTYYKCKTINKYNMRIYLTETVAPRGGATFYKPEFRTMPILDIELLLEDYLHALEKAGYNAFTIHRATGTVSVRKIKKIKTIDDIFETDKYGILYIDK